MDKNRFSKKILEIFKKFAPFDTIRLCQKPIFCNFIDKLRKRHEKDTRRYYNSVKRTVGVENPKFC